MSTAFTYTVKVIISQKQCKIEMLLIQTTNRKSYVPIDLHYFRE